MTFHDRKYTGFPGKRNLREDPGNEVAENVDQLSRKLLGAGSRETEWPQMLQVKTSK